MEFLNTLKELGKKFRFEMKGNVYTGIIYNIFKFYSDRVENDLHLAVILKKRDFIQFGFLFTLEI